MKKNTSNNKLPEKTVQRLLIYKSILEELKKKEVKYIRSNELEKFTHYKQELIRRDIMAISFKGNTSKGYNIDHFLERIIDTLRLDKKINVGIVGVGRIGQALLSYFKEKKTRFEIKASFDKDPTRINNCQSAYNISYLEKIINDKNISLVILAVPKNEAQRIANILNETKIKSILNFSDITIKVKDDIIVNSIDILLEVEKLSFYSQ